MCVIAAVGVAPCQCFSLGENQITSPGRISSIGPPQRCAQPRPNVTINVWPNGCVCQAVRAPGSNVTLAPRTRAGSGASNNGSILTFPVNQSAGPLLELREPFLLISIPVSAFQFFSFQFLSTSQRLNLCFCSQLSAINSQLSGSPLVITFPSPDRIRTNATDRRRPRQSRARARSRNNSGAAPSAER